LTIFILSVLISSSVYAEMITLDSGKTIEGTIVERTDEYIEVDEGVGVNITYFMDEVVSIEESVAMKDSKGPEPAAPIADEFGSEDLKVSINGTETGGVMYTYPGEPHQPKLLNVEGTFVHPSGMIFPPAVGRAKRTLLVQYDADGKDISAGYDQFMFSDKLSATVYVYPEKPHTPFPTDGSMPREVASFIMCAQEFGLSRNEVLQTIPGTKLIEEEDVFLPLGDLAHRGSKAIFEMTLKLPGAAPQELESHLYVFCVGSPWHLKYRFSYPKGVDATSEIDQFLSTLEIAIKTEPSDTHNDTIFLKSGIRVVGMILEETDEYIKIEAGGAERTYKHDEIKEVER